MVEVGTFWYDSKFDAYVEVVDRSEQFEDYQIRFTDERYFQDSGNWEKEDFEYWKVEEITEKEYKKGLIRKKLKQ